jgi:acetyltransferase-like isoleucine patch superfamily enzyme
MIFNIKIFLLKVIKFIAIKIFNVFFNRKYLKGRTFTDDYSGYVFCLKAIWSRNFLRLATPFPWPVGLNCHISSSENITFHVDDLNNFQSPGVYLQNFNGHITIGKGSYIAPNVGIITSNHNLGDLRKHNGGIDVVLGEGCWIGMNSVILPGVILGNKTIVAAGAVVTHSFLDGNLVIGGTPAKIIKTL